MQEIILAKKSQRKKHHYLPRYYLNGFTDKNNLFYVYDKREDRILPKPLTPSAVFFENNLNTITSPNGETSDFLEGLYTDIENTTRDSLKSIRQSNPKCSIKLLDKMNFFSFLLFLHWRLPSNIKYVEKLSKSFFLEGNDFSFFQLKSKCGEEVPDEVKAAIKDSLAFKKTAKLVIPFAPFYKNNWVDKLMNWRFSYTGDGQTWHLVGDNPIVTRGTNDHDPIDCLNEFIFPVSGNILLISVNDLTQKELPPKFTVEFNVAIIKRARRFVACQRLDFLKSLIGYYKMHAGAKKENIIINEMFSILEN